MKRPSFLWKWKLIWRYAIAIHIALVTLQVMGYLPQWVTIQTLSISAYCFGRYVQQEDMFKAVVTITRTPKEGSSDEPE